MILHNFQLKISYDIAHLQRNRTKLNKIYPTIKVVMVKVHFFPLFS